MKNKSLIFLVFILTLTTLFVVGCGRDIPLPPSENVSGTSGAPVNTPENSQENTGDTSFRMVRNPWNWGSGSLKDIPDCDLGRQIFDLLGALKETGKTDPKINDDKEFNEISVMAAPRGTLWLDCGSIGLFRIAPDFSQICRVDAALGEGKILENNEELAELLKTAWFYYPSDTWQGKCENGGVTLTHVYKNASNIEDLKIAKISLPEGGDNGSLTLVVTANDTFDAGVSIMSQQSDDNLAGSDYKLVHLEAGLETEVELSFGGFDCPYCLNISIQDSGLSITNGARAEITIVP